MSKESFSRTQLWSAYFGNLFEHYDTALFGFLSSFLAPLIFPKEDPLTALILTYAMIPLGMLARPLGSIFFGYIGDLYGRRHALFLTLAGMGIVSACIAFSPTYAQVGLLAPLIFCVGRLLQNFFTGGESMGGAIFLLENAPEKRHDLLSGLYNASTIAGILAASAGVSLLSYTQRMDPGWRFLYLFGCLTALFGCVLRTSKSPITVQEEAPTKIGHIALNHLKTFWTCRKPLVLIALCAGFSYSNYSIALVVLNGFVPLISPLTKTQMMALNTTLLVFDFVLLPFFGWLASKLSREKLMLGAALSVTLLAVPLFLLLNGASFLTVIWIRMAFVIFGVAFFAPFHAWAQQLVPSQHRYGVISFAYAMGSQALGGPAAAISLWCFKKTEIVSSVSWYLTVLAAASSLFIFLAMKSKKKREPWIRIGTQSLKKI